MYKLVALDLDGTLFNSCSEISPANLQAVHDLADAGIMTVISSGRPYEVVRAVLEKLDLLRKDYFSIVCNGSRVVNNYSGEELFSYTMTGDLVAELGYLADSTKCFIHGFSVSRGLLMNQENPYSSVECFNGLIPFQLQNFREVKSEEAFYKVLLCAEKSHLDEVISALSPDFYERFKIIRSLDFLLEFLSPQAGKGAALLSMGRRFGIDPGEMMAFGDQENDLDMLSVVGMPVAMGNASDYIKEQAGFVTLTNDEDGVSYGIRRLILDRL